MCVLELSVNKSENKLYACFYIEFLLKYLCLWVLILRSHTFYN